MPVPPPEAPRRPTTLERPGTPVVDDWAWLADRDDPDTLAYLRAENAYTDAWLAPLQALRSTLFDEIKRRTQETDLSAPARKGAWWYLSRTIEGLDYPVHVRRPAREHERVPEGRPEEVGDQAAETVVLDENAEAAGGDYFAVGAFEVSPSQRWLAWSADREGDEVFELRVRDLSNGADLDRIPGTSGYGGVAWAAGERHLFYVTLDDTKRPYRVWRHQVGTAPAADVLVFDEPDERFYVEIELSRSEAWVVITSASRTTTEVLVIPADRPEQAPRSVAGRRPDHEYGVDHRGQSFVILTNLDAEDFRVVVAPEDDPSPEHWAELVAHRPGRRIRSVDAFAGHVLLHEWEAGLPRLRLLYDGGEERVLVFDEDVHSVEPAANPEFDTTLVRFEYESYLTPPSVLEEDVRTGERRTLKRTPVLDGYDPATYVTTREWAPAPDGTLVPLDVVRHRATPVDGSAPAVVYGYGAYEWALAPWFSVPRLSLLDRGVVFAVAHPRGGGELGRRWYLDGRLERKVNSFTDFLACAEHLVHHGFADAHRLAFRGGSAGGLLVGAALARRPDLPAAVVAEVPFVDVVTTMLDPSLPLTVTEREEWGDPTDPDMAAGIAAYSPYDNVRPVPYPAMLVTAGLNDPRVSYHEPAKWVARIRAVTTGDRPVLLRTELGAGHAGRSGRYDAWHDEADVLAFVLHTLGVA